MDELGVPHNQQTSELTNSHLDDLCRRGIFVRKDHGSGVRLWSHVKPREPGKAAEHDARRGRGSGLRRDISGSIAGTGKRASRRQKGVSEEVNSILRTVQANGATVTETERGHFIIAGKGERIIIAPKPNPSGLVKDKARLRKAGLLTT